MPVHGKTSSVPSKVTARPSTRSRMTEIASSSVFMLVGGLPSTRRALSPRPIPRSMRPPLSSLSTASADAVTLGSRVAGLVTQVPRRIVVVASAISVRSTYGSRHRTWLSKSQPWVKPLASARRVRSSVRRMSFSGLSVNPKSMPDVATSALSFQSPRTRPAPNSLVWGPTSLRTRPAPIPLSCGEQLTVVGVGAGVLLSRRGLRWDERGPQPSVGGYSPHLRDTSTSGTLAARSHAVTAGPGRRRHPGVGRDRTAIAAEPR